MGLKTKGLELAKVLVVYIDSFFKLKQAVSFCGAV